MKFEQPKLKYAVGDLEPHISALTVEYHYGKHTKKYYETTNALLKGTIFEKKADKLEDLLTRDTLLKADSVLFSNASQAWNHTFFFDSLCPAKQSGKPSDALLDEINRAFGSLKAFIEAFNAKATSQFGSFWIWAAIRNGSLVIKTTPNCATVLTEPNTTPLFVMDGWEHAYYLDCQNEKAKYYDAFWEIINWDTVSDRYDQAMTAFKD